MFGQFKYVLSFQARLGVVYFLPYDRTYTVHVVLLIDSTSSARHVDSACVVCKYVVQYKPPFPN